MPIIEKQLDAGKWRIQVSGEIVSVRLKGLRGRWHPLQRIERDDFHSRLMKRPNGEITDPAVLRGVPSVYCHEGPWLMLWPSPANAWMLEIDVTRKAKDAA